MDLVRIGVGLTLPNEPVWGEDYNLLSSDPLHYIEKVEAILLVDVLEQIRASTQSKERGGNSSSSSRACATTCSSWMPCSRLRSTHGA